MVRKKITDITMCQGSGCPLKESCYRYTAIENKYRQSWFDPQRKEDGSCDHYYPMTEGLPTSTQPR